MTHLIRAVCMLALSALCGCDHYFEASTSFARTDQGYINHGLGGIGLLYAWDLDNKRLLFVAYLNPTNDDMSELPSGTVDTTHMTEVSLTAKANVPVGTAGDQMKVAVSNDFNNNASIHLATVTNRFLHDPTPFLRKAMQQKLSQGGTPEDYKMDVAANKANWRYIMVFREYLANQGTFKYASSNTSSATVTIPLGTIFDGNAVVTVNDATDFQAPNAQQIRVLIDIAVFKLTGGPALQQPYKWDQDSSVTPNWRELNWVRID